MLLYFTGAVLFELHAFDLINELSNILSDLNSKKTPLWMQMRFVEVFASMLAEQLMAHGTKIFVSPDEIKWPDGTVTKPYESKGLKGRKKKKNPHAKDGVYGRIVHEYGGRNKKTKSEEAANQVLVVNVDNEGGGDEPKKKNRGTDSMLNKNLLQIKY